MLAGNIAINALDNVTALNMALGGARGFVDMPPFDYEGVANFGALDVRGMLRNEEAKPEFTPVQLQRLDEISYARNTSLIKLDVEGMELAVLRGGIELLKRRRPALFVENNLPGEASEALIKFFCEMEYDCYWQICFSFNESNYRQNKNNVFGRGNCINILAVPQSATSDIRGMRKVSSIEDHPYKWISQTSERNAIQA